MNTTAPPPMHPEAAALAARLPRLGAGQAAACRLAFDARFQRWLAVLLDAPALAVRAGGAPQPLCLQLVGDAGGACTLALDIADWPALQAAAALPDAATAGAVLTLLLQPLCALLRPALGAVQVHRAEADSAVAATVCTGTGSVALLACTPALAQQLQLLWPRTAAADLDALHPLRLRARVHLMQRRWPWPVLAALQPGDLVLAPPGPPALRWTLGWGHTLQAAVALDLQQQAMHLMDTPHTDTDIEPESDATGTEGPPAHWASLQLPVSFELDTARVSLAELSALRPGSAIELDQPLAEATVRLMCQGQALGQGQLVAIGERLGVRITQMGLAPVLQAGGGHGADGLS